MKKVLRLLAILAAVLLCVLPANVAKASEEEVAEMTIFSDGSGGTLGVGTHAFLYFENISGQNITVLGNVVAPGRGITVGTFGNKADGLGIYIDLEAYGIEHGDGYSNRVSVTIRLTQSKLNQVNSTMEGNNKWTLTKNCAWFATQAWNKVCPSNKKLSAGVIPTPATLSKNIKKISGYATKKSVSKAYVGSNTSAVKRHKNGTNYAVSAGTLDGSGNSSSSFFSSGS